MSAPISPPDSPWSVADHDHGEQHPGADEVRKPEEERAGTQERLAPDEVEALREPRAQRRDVRLTFLLERCPHREERDGRKRVRERVDDEGDCTADPEERAAERRSREPHHSLPARLGCRGCRELVRRHDGTQRAGLSAEEQGGADALDERYDHDFPEDDPVEQDRHGERPDREHAHPVGQDHQAPAAPAVGGQPRGQREEHPWQASREPDEAGLGRRVRDRENEQRECDRRRLRADVRQQLPDLQQHEVAVAT